MTLTKKQQRFVNEYLIDLNGKQAAIRAGYTVRRAEVTASELIANRKVSEAIAQKMVVREKRTEITQDRVLKELARIAFFDLRKLYREDGSLKDMHELDDDAAAVLAGVDVVETKGNAEVGGPAGLRHQPEFVKKVKIPDKVAALSLAMRHLGMLKDKVEHSGGLTLRRSAQELTDDELAAIAAGGGEGAADQA
ncbi:terminase small subunit [Variovorax sp. NFACC27]|uniref:terminase small subunit n=1 Tax=unclassified Variovorax TaxID=663243 RepID=UPI000896A5C4|nr:phage terminase small subunit [Variovorax sp. NFACC28]SEG89644.1 phage terminase small subunit [Variovorax sp. NFACC29]SFD40333.1 phage terminase small subunit [Variovorax sp. NFACC26]SFG42600.1 phage terminase small subunit [Variovorax sp. NFACC27]